MKQLLVVLVICGLACCTEHSSSAEVSNHASKDTLLCAVDTNGFEILPYEQWLGLVDVTEDTLHPLSLQEFEKMECLLAKEVDSWNADSIQHYPKDARIDLKKYGRQYCALTNEQGHRIVLLNMFCRSLSENKGWVIVEDGGHCYFQTLFDLSIGSVLYLSVNGHA